MYKFLLLALFLLTGCTQQEIGLSTLKPIQGGTGISSATTSDVGKALVVSDDSPFTYSLQTVSGTSSGGGSTTTLSATNVAYGNTDNTVTGTPEFYYTSSTQQLTVPNVSSTSVTSTNLHADNLSTLSGLTFTNGPLRIQYAGASAISIYDVDAAIGGELNFSALTTDRVFNFPDAAGDIALTSDLALYLPLTGGSLSGGLELINATSTGYFVSRTSTIQGGFFQTGLSTCNADGETLAYNATTGKFECGDDDSGGAASVSLTNTLVAFGDLNNQITSSSVFSFTTSTGLLLVPSVSSTSVTTTNLSVSGSLSLPVDSITDAMVVGALTIDGGTINNTPIGETGASTAVFTNATSTNFFSSGLSFTNGNGTSITSTNGNITTFTFGTAVGTSVTTTNLRFDSATFTGSIQGTGFSSISAFDASFTSLTLSGGLVVPSVSTTGVTASKFWNMTFANATGTVLVISTSTITGGFFQTDFTDCEADNQTVSYDVTTGKFGCGDDDTGGSGSSLWTDAGFYTYLTSSTSDLAIGNTTTSSAPFWWDVSATTSYVGNGGAGDSSIQVGPDENAWIFGFDDTDDSFVISSSTILGTNNALSIAKGSLDVTVGGLLFTRATGTSVTSTNLSVSSLTSLAGLTFTNATGTGQFRIATTTITGGFNQTGLADCDTASSTIIYDLTTQKLSCQTKGKTSYTNIYTASTTWTKPVTSTGFVGVYAWCVGGGGGGGGSGTAGNIGGGGAGGGASYEYIPASSLTSTAVVTVGVAGAGGAAGNNNGTAGGTSSFGTFITCTGGNGGNAGNGASSQTTAGVGSGGDINGSGRNGREPGAYTDSYRGYGGAAGTNQGDVSADQIQDSLSNTMSGGGILGMYAGGGGTRPGSWDAASRNGNGGQSFGGGGSGGQKVGAGADASGANGKQGVVVIVELYN